MASQETHVKIRNRKTGGVWECPAGVVEAALDKDDPFMGSGWMKAAESSTPTDEKPVVAARTTKEN